MTKLKTIFFAASALTLVIITACSNAAQIPDAGTGGSAALPEAPFVEGGASLILSPDKLTIRVTVRTADSTPIRIEGCTETELTSGTETVLHAKGTVVILKGKIIKLNCHNNQLTALNVQGCTSLQVLSCWGNQLTALNVQGLPALQYLNCGGNRLTALDVQGLTALERLYCYDRQLTALNAQGCTALQRLNCYNNRLTALNVQGCTALKTLECRSNQLTELNVQGLTALQELNCAGNQLTALNVQGCTALQMLECYNNQLTAQAFTKLFNDLPKWDSDDAWCILYTEESGVTEGNYTDFTAPQDLKDAFDNAKNNKKWEMYKRNGSGPEVEI